MPNKNDMHLASVERVSTWDDVMQKAKRLILSGQVTLQRNGWNNVVSTVVGDHGQYQVEIGRDDPNSRVITQWTCECPWDQFAFDRTRVWKKYEGRVCSHALATLWSSLGAPLDDDVEQEKRENTPFQKKPDPNQPYAPAIPDPMEMPFDQRSFDPNDPTNLRPGQNDPTQPGQSNMDILDQQLQGIQAQDPDQFDFSLSPYEQEMRKKYPGLFGYSAVNDSFEAIRQMVNPTTPGQKRTQPNVKVLRNVQGELRGGKIPQPGAEPIGQYPEGNPMYNWKDLGWNNSLGTLHEPRKDGPEQRGTYGIVPAGSTAQVLDVDPNSKQVWIVYYTDQYKLHPHLIKCWVDSKDVQLAKGGVAPYRQRRR